jgi:hypothetical protein
MGHISYCELWIHFEDTLFVAHFLFQVCCLVGAESYGGRVALVAIKFGKSIHHTPTALRGEHWRTPLNSFVLHRTSELGFLCFAQNIRIRCFFCFVLWTFRVYLVFRGVPPDSSAVTAHCASVVATCSLCIFRLSHPLLSSARGGVWGGILASTNFWLPSALHTHCSAPTHIAAC